MSYSKTYISNQIAVVKNAKALIEFVDKLNPASTNSYAHIHAGKWEQDEENERAYSLIGILMKDYSQGKGDNAVTVTCNLLPEEIQYYLSILETREKSFSDSQSKIFGLPDKDGNCKVTQFYIGRSDNAELRMPWRIIIENGSGKPQSNQMGGTTIAKGTYQCHKKVTVNMTDKDLYKCLKRVDAFIKVWEMTYGIPILKEAKKIIAERTANNK